MKTAVTPLLVLALATPLAAQEATVFVSPAAPHRGGPLRAVAVADHSLDASFVLAGPDGATIAATRRRRGGPPYWWYLDVTTKRTGRHRACLDTTGTTCADVVVGESPQPVGDGLWPVAREWNRATEALYSAWVAHLFDDPLDAEPSWRSLHEVTRQPARNFLHGHLGLGEDGATGLVLEPDCADLPHFLRAYFAWKLRLPFGWSECTRGAGGGPPHCSRWRSHLGVARGGRGLARMQTFFARDLAWGVHSGGGRTPAEAERTDFYPTRLSVETLRPGTVYADPYGHTLVLVRRVPQTATSPGQLLAVDAQPDGTVARKRYWRGNFAFALDPERGSAGFKRSRPIVSTRAGLRPLDNHEIAAAADWGDYSLEQYAPGVEGFYDRVDDVLTPDPVDAAAVFRTTIDALEEQVRTRVRSVANGEAWVATHPGRIPMPDGAAIFETTGPWEDYATPSRDLRLLVAIDVVRGFPARAARRPHRYAGAAAASPAALRDRLDELLRDEVAARRFEYTRSDGSSWTLTLGDVLARAAALEVAYDPNDCVEVRWGAPPGSEEMRTCRRRAPADHMARMAQQRTWFRERTRPPR